MKKEELNEIILNNQLVRPGDLIYNKNKREQVENPVTVLSIIGVQNGAKRVYFLVEEGEKLSIEDATNCEKYLVDKKIKSHKTFKEHIQELREEINQGEIDDDELVLKLAEAVLKSPEETSLAEIIKAIKSDLS